MTARRASAGRPIRTCASKDMERDGVQAEVIFGILGAATRLDDHEAAARDVPHLQRLARRLLPPLSGAAHRPGVPALRRHRRRGAGDPPRGEDGPARPRAVVLVGHGADVASGVGAALAGGERGAPAAALPHLPDACRPSVREKATGLTRARRDVHQRLRLPDEPRQHPRRGDRRRGARALPEPAHLVRRERHRLAALRARPHGLRVGGPLPRPGPHA